MPLLKMSLPFRDCESALVNQKDHRLVSVLFLDQMHVETLSMEGLE